MNDFVNKAKDFADQHDEQVDKGLERAGEEADKRTGGKYDAQTDKGVDFAQQRTGGGHGGVQRDVDEHAGVVERAPQQHGLPVVADDDGDHRGGHRRADVVHLEAEVAKPVA